MITSGSDRLDLGNAKSRTLRELKQLAEVEGGGVTMDEAMLMSLAYFS